MAETCRMEVILFLFGCCLLQPFVTGDVSLPVNATETTSVTNCLNSGNCWVRYNFTAPSAWNDCAGGAKYVRKTNYSVGMYVGVELCSPTKYKLFLSNDLTSKYSHIADGAGHGNDHCEFLGGEENNARVSSREEAEHSPRAQGFFRSSWGSPVKYGMIGRDNGHWYYPKSYTCGVTVPGSDRVIGYDESPGETVVTSTLTPTDTTPGDTQTTHYTPEVSQTTYTTPEDTQTTSTPETISVADCLNSGNCWVRYNFTAPSTWNDCAGGAKYVRKTNYSEGMYVGVELCSPTKYKLFLSNDLTSKYSHIADGAGHGNDHCEFLGGEESNARVSSREEAEHSPRAQGFRRSSWGRPVEYGMIGRDNGHWYYPKSYTCGVTVPGSDRVIDYDSPGETVVTSTLTPTYTTPGDTPTTHYTPEVSQTTHYTHEDTQTTYTTPEDTQTTSTPETISVADCLNSGNCWVRYNFTAPSTWNDCAGGAKYVRKTNYSEGMYVGVELCSPTKYKLFLSNDLTSKYSHIADGAGHGNDHCEFLGGEENNARVSSREEAEHSPRAQGFRRSSWGRPVKYGMIGRDNGHWYYPKSYTCGVTVPGSDRVIGYDESPGETVVTSTLTPTDTIPEDTQTTHYTPEVSQTTHYTHEDTQTTYTTPEDTQTTSTLETISVADCLNSGNCWVRYNFTAPSTWNDCAGGAKYVRKTNYSEGMYVGVELCSPTKYKLFLSNDLTSKYSHIADGAGHGNDHCEFLGGEENNARVSSREEAEHSPRAQGFRRSSWGRPVKYGMIGRDNGHWYYPKSYTCGVTVPGSDRVIGYDESPGETVVTSTLTPSDTIPEDTQTTHYTPEVSQTTHYTHEDTQTTDTTPEDTQTTSTLETISVADCLNSGNCWVRYNFTAPSTWNDCAGGAKYVRKTNYSEGMYVGVELCSPTKYKLFLSNDLTSKYSHIADGAGHGNDHCEFLGGEENNARVSSREEAEHSPRAQGFRRSSWGRPVKYGMIGRDNGHWYYPKSYTCGVTVPGSDRVIDYDSPGETVVTSTLTPTYTTPGDTQTTHYTPEVTQTTSTPETISVADCLNSGNCWVRYNFTAPSTWNDCAGGAKYVRKTNYSEGMYVGVELCSPTKYKLFLSNNLTSEYKHIGDGAGIGDDHCEFVGGIGINAFATREGAYMSPTTEGFRRSNWGDTLTYGKIGRLPDYWFYPKSYECGVTVPGSDRVTEYDGSSGETVLTSTMKPTYTTPVGTRTTPTPAPDFDFNNLEGYSHRNGDCGDNDIKMMVATVDVCAEECNELTDCKSIMFNDQGSILSYCWLKYSDCRRLSRTSERNLHFYNKLSPTTATTTPATIPEIKPSEALTSCSMKKLDNAAIREVGMELTKIRSGSLCEDKCREITMCDGATFNKDKNECLLHLRRGFLLSPLSKDSCCTTYKKVCPLIKSPVPPPKEQILCPIDKGSRKPSDKYAYRVLRLKDNFDRGEYSCRTDELCAGLSFEVTNGDRVDFTYYYDTTPEHAAPFSNFTAIKNCRPSGPTCRHMKAVFGMILKNANHYRSKTEVETRAECLAACEGDQAKCSAATFRRKTKECWLYHVNIEDDGYQLELFDGLVNTWVRDPGLCPVPGVESN